MTGIAYQYALAVFSLAEEAKYIDQFKDDLSAFTKSLDEGTNKFFSHPKIDKADKIDVLEKTVTSRLLLNFLKVLVDNDRFSLLEAILLAYQDILDNLYKVMNVTVYSNKKLSEENIAKIKTKLKKTYNRTIEIDLKIDESILGGFRIEFEGNIIDETINKQLENIKSSLLE